MDELPLFGTCTLPGCRNPVVGEGACAGCRDLWGNYLLGPGEVIEEPVRPLPSCGHGLWWFQAAAGRCGKCGCTELVEQPPHRIESRWPAP